MNFVVFIRGGAAAESAASAAPDSPDKGKRAAAAPLKVYFFHLLFMYIGKRLQQNYAVYENRSRRCCCLTRKLNKMTWQKCDRERERRFYYYKWVKNRLSDQKN